MGASRPLSIKAAIDGMTPLNAAGKRLPASGILPFTGDIVHQTVDLISWRGPGLDPETKYSAKTGQVLPTRQQLLHRIGDKTLHRRFITSQDRTAFHWGCHAAPAAATHWALQ